MTRTSTIVLAAVCLTLLAGAWIASRVLTSDVSAPPTLMPVSPRPPAVAAPVRVEPPAPSAIVAQLPEPARAQAPPASPSLAPAPDARPPEADPESDYADENSPAVAEEWRAAFGPKAGIAEWKHAVQVFQRCLVQAPGHQRCQQGLAAVQASLSATVPSPAPAPGLRAPDGLRRRHDNRTGEE